MKQFSIVLLAVLLIITGCKPDGQAAVVLSNEPPTAYIDSINPNVANPGDSIQFNGHGEPSDPSGSIISYRWTSNKDGVLSTSQTFNKGYSELSIGTHIIYFTVQDDTGTWSAPDTKTLKINNHYYTIYPINRL